MKRGVCLYVFLALGCGETSPSSLPDADVSRGGFSIADEPGLLLGTATAMDSELLIVGVPGHDDGGIESGAVRVLRIADGQEMATLLAPEPAPGDRFGASVALDPNTRLLAVGAPGRDAPERDTGGVFLFEWTGSEFGTAVDLSFEKASLGDRFGSSVALSGDVLAVGASGDERGGLDAGALYLFDRDGDTWVPR